GLARLKKRIWSPRGEKRPDRQGRRKQARRATAGAGPGGDAFLASGPGDLGGSVCDHHYFSVPAGTGGGDQHVAGAGRSGSTVHQQIGVSRGGDTSWGCGG